MRARAKDLLVSATLLVAGRRRTPRLRRGDRERVVPAGEADSRSELVAIACFLASAVCAAAFVAFYALDRLPNQTQLQGGTIGLAFSFLAAGLIVTARRLVSNEQVEHDYPVDEYPEEQELLVQ